MTCHSGGTLEIYVEPHLPAPALWIAGTTPIAAAVASLGAATGWRVSVFDPVAEAEAFPGVELRLAGDRAPADRPGRDARTSSSRPRGSGTRRRSTASCRRDRVAYVGLVASPTRAAVVRAWLRDEGVPEERLAALRAPAGMDLGAETPEEVAISILAELVQVRRGRASFVAMPGPATLAGGGGGRRRTAARARRRRHRPRRPRVRHDRRPRARPAPRRARRHRLRVLPDGLPDRASSRSRRAYVGASPRPPSPDPVTHPPESRMQFQGTVQIEAPRDKVWAFLLDPNQVGSCGPGVESIEVIDEDHFRAKAKVGHRVHLGAGSRST